MYRKIRTDIRKFMCCAGFMIMSAGHAHADLNPATDENLLSELELSTSSSLEEAVRQESGVAIVEGIASYYAKRLHGKRTTSGHRYHPDKMTAAHHSLPMGTVVKVVNRATNQEVHVTINDRCSKKPYPFIDLSRAAAKKIGLWGKGKIKVVIIPLLEKSA